MRSFATDKPLFSESFDHEIVCYKRCMKQSETIISWFPTHTCLPLLYSMLLYIVYLVL